MSPEDMDALMEECSKLLEEMKALSQEKIPLLLQPKIPELM